MNKSDCSPRVLNHVVDASSHDSLHSRANKWVSLLLFCLSGCSRRAIIVAFSGSVSLSGLVSRWSWWVMLNGIIPEDAYVLCVHFEQRVID